MVEKVYAEKPKKGEAWDIAIIGSGPASFTAAIYTTRGAASTIILGGANWGGQLMLTTEVDNYPALPGIQGPKLMEKMKEHATRFGGEFVAKDVTEVDFSQKPFTLRAGDNEYKANSVIVATGAETKWLGIPGEDEYRGRGVSSCAPCDAPFYKGKKVMVVGGGDSAMEEALVLTKYADEVTVVHRRDELKASAAMQKRFFEQVDEGKANIIWDTEVVEMMGDKVLNGAKFKTSKGTETEKKLEQETLEKYNGKIVDEDDGYKYWQADIEGIFVAIGHKPATKMFKGEIELDKKGYIKKNLREGFSTTTNVDGVFVAGDVHDYHYRQAVTAAGFGCMAGMDALNYLDKDAPIW